MSCSDDFTSPTGSGTFVNGPVDTVVNFHFGVNTTPISSDRGRESSGMAPISAAG